MKPGSLEKETLEKSLLGKGARLEDALRRIFSTVPFGPDYEAKRRVEIEVGERSYTALDQEAGFGLKDKSYFKLLVRKGNYTVDISCEGEGVIGLKFANYNLTIPSDGIEEGLMIAVDERMETFLTDLDSWIAENRKPPADATRVAESERARLLDVIRSL